MPSLFVGLDLGGSGTRAALADTDGAVLATGLGPTGLQGRGSARRLLARALDAALAPITARVGDDEAVVFAGTRGLSVPGRRAILELELHSRFPNATIRVANDALIGLWGGLGGEPGVAVLAGSGSIALARNAEGAEGRAGGWGYMLGDEGSGYWIGREALRSYLRTLEDREPASTLHDLLKEQIGRASVVDVLAWMYTGEGQVERVAALASLVSRAAEAADPSGVQILQQAGEALAIMAAAASHQVPGTDATVVRIGGVWSAHAALHDAFAARLRQLLPAAKIAAPRLPPLGGALLLAIGADRAPVARQVVDRLGTTL
jgi:N-acetylglucosamine kinase-like BadF-type ATPase